MSEESPAPELNRLLEKSSRKDRATVLGACEPVELVFGTVLCEPDRAIRQVYFPLTGLISLVETLAGRQPLEVALVGNEGMLGVTLLLGIDNAPTRAVVKGSGAALRMSSARFRRTVQQGSPSLLRTFNRYLYVSLLQLSRTAACTHFHRIEARLARWLLMTHDRAHSDQFRVTHAFLAQMLGVRRSGVTVAAGALQRRKLIRYNRGVISVLDRGGLEAASCECYAVAIDDYGQWLGASGGERRAQPRRTDRP